MQCFVIMPFAAPFGDVYATIKATAENALPGEAIECRRLDEIKRPGRISDDLIHEITSASFCVADLTGNNANVMWEVGYAMALQKPIVFLSQDVASLPFDIRDMRTIKYDRQALSGTLRDELATAIRATLGSHHFPRQDTHLNAKPRPLRAIAITGSMLAVPEQCRSRLPIILRPYLAQKTEWYCGSVGAVDEAVLAFLIDNKESVTVVGYHAYDISERILSLVRAHNITFIDAQKENLPRGLNATSFFSRRRISRYFSGMAGVLEHGS